MALPALIVEAAFNADAGPAYQEAVLASFPVGYWRLATNFADLSGNALTGTKVGTVTQGQAGALAGDTDASSLFDGATGYVDVPHVALIDGIATAWTLEAWVYPTLARNGNSSCVISKAWTTGASIPFVLAYGNPSVDFQPGIANNTSCISAGIFSAGTGLWTATSDGNSLPLNTWTYVVATYDGTTIRLYKNGALASSVAAIATSSSGLDVLIGRRWDSAGTAPFFPGRIDEAALYNYALSADAIAYHYDARNVLIPASWTWTALTSRTRRVATQRGRNNEQDHAQAGQIQATFKNDDRALEPGYPLSPYYPNVTLSKPLRVRADNTVNGGTIVPIMGGNLDKLPENWITPEYGEVDVTASDVLAALNGDEGITVDAPSELTGARQARLAKAVGLRAADVTIDAGTYNVQAQTYVNANALSAANVTETTEGGYLYAGKDYGTLVFKDKSARALSHQASRFTFGDAGDATEYPYTKLSPSFDNTWLYSQVVVSAAGFNDQVASDTTSRRKNRRKTLPLDTLHVNEGNMLSSAQFWLARYAQALRRIDSIEVTLTDSSPAQMVTDCLSLELGDRITVVARPGHVAGAPVISIQCNVENIGWVIDTAKPVWVMTLQLSPADLTVSWTLSTTGFSELGSTTRLSG